MKKLSKEIFPQGQQPERFPNKDFPGNMSRRDFLKAFAGCLLSLSFLEESGRKGLSLSEEKFLERERTSPVKKIETNEAIFYPLYGEPEKIKENIPLDTDFIFLRPHPLGFSFPPSLEAEIPPTVFATLMFPSISSKMEFLRFLAERKIKIIISDVAPSPLSEIKANEIRHQTEEGANQALGVCLASILGGALLVNLLADNRKNATLHQTPLLALLQNWRKIILK